MPLQFHEIFLHCIYTAHCVFGYLKVEFRIVVAWWLDTLDTELMCRLGLTNHFTVVEFQAVAYAGCWCFDIKQWSLKKRRVVVCLGFNSKSDNWRLNWFRFLAYHIIVFSFFSSFDIKTHLTQVRNIIKRFLEAAKTWMNKIFLLLHLYMKPLTYICNPISNSHIILLLPY